MRRKYRRYVNTYLTNQPHWESKNSYRGAFSDWLGDAYNATMGRAFDAAIGSLKWVGCGVYGNLPTGRGCRRAASERVRQALGDSPSWAIGCALEVIGSTSELASIKGLGKKLAKKVFMSNLFFLGATCIVGATRAAVEK